MIQSCKTLPKHWNNRMIWLIKMEMHGYGCVLNIVAIDVLSLYHQYPWYWLNIHHIGPVSYRYIAVIGNRIIKWNYILKKITVLTSCRTCHSSANDLFFFPGEFSTTAGPKCMQTCNMIIVAFGGRGCIKYEYLYQRNIYVLQTPLI